MTCLLALFLLASAPRAPETAESLVREKLLAPLLARDDARPRYSRAGPPPSQRRVRVLDSAPLADGKGGAFVSYAIDSRYGGRWTEKIISGCVYPATGEVYVRLGNAFRDASILLGKPASPAASHICRAITPSPAGGSASIAAR